MQRNLERLERSLTWQLLAPDPGCVFAPLVCSASAQHPQLLEDVQASRVKVFGSDDSIPDEDTRSTDSAAWHFVALDGDGRVAGAMRLFVIDRRHQSLRPRDILRFGHVEFPSPCIEAAHVEALEQFFKQKTHEPIYIYAGGFFTDQRWRGSGLAAVLGMAAIAMARLLNSQFAASFVSARDRAPELFAMLGGAPLQSATGESLAPFHCPRHGFSLQLMAFDARKPDPKVEEGLDLMTARLCRTKVLIPEVTYA